MPAPSLEAVTRGAFVNSDGTLSREGYYFLRGMFDFLGGANTPANITMVIDQRIAAYALPFAAAHG